jgi:hypothetical protein
MALRRCDNHQHFFNPEQYSHCPYCRGVDPNVGPTGGFRAQEYAAMQQQRPPVQGPSAAGLPAVAAPAAGATVGVAHKALGFEPVVGWLVCVAGPTRGQDYRIPDGASVIGRGHGAHIRIDGDATISHDQATIVFDRRTTRFFVTPGRGRNPTYVNGQLLLSERQLQAREHLEMGESILMFVPLCGEEFSWGHPPVARTR